MTSNKILFTNILFQKNSFKKINLFDEEQEFIQMREKKIKKHFIWYPEERISNSLKERDISLLRLLMFYTHILKIINKDQDEFDKISNKFFLMYLFLE
jgi:hypothetical protein